MSVTISGSGTITGISAGGLPDGSITNDDLAGSITDAKLSGTTCKAWVNFDGTGTPTARASFNVSSITDNGTGDYTVNFTTALADGTYGISLGCEISHSGGNFFGVGLFGAATITASSFKIRALTGGGSAWDPEVVTASVFR
jgi:hypothetical protein